MTSILCAGQSDLIPVAADSLWRFEASLSCRFCWWPWTESNRRRQPFQGRLPNLLKWFRINRNNSGKGPYERTVLSRLGINWGWSGPSKFAYCSRGFLSLNLQSPGIIRRNFQLRSGHRKSVPIRSSSWQWRPTLAHQPSPTPRFRVKVWLANPLQEPISRGLATANLPQSRDIE